MPGVDYAERAFLKLIARRVLGYAKEADSRGEEYHDIGSFSPLHCGVRAKYRFEKSAGSYVPVVTLKNNRAFSPEELSQIAAEILEGDAVLRPSAGDDLEYIRKVDSTPETKNA